MNVYKMTRERLQVKELNFFLAPITLPSIYLQTWCSEPIDSVEITAKITFEEKRLADAQENDPVTVKDAFLMLTNTKSQVQYKVGPLTLIGPDLLKDLLPALKRHPDYGHLTRVVLPYLALLEFEKGAVAANSCTLI